VDEVVISGVAGLIAGILTFKQLAHSLKHPVNKSGALGRKMGTERLFDEVQGFTGLHNYI
jgi:hypothetical protein